MDAATLAASFFSPQQAQPTVSMQGAQQQLSKPPPDAQTKAAVKSRLEQIQSHAMELMRQTEKQLGIKLDPDLFMKQFTDTLKQHAPQLTSDPNAMIQMLQQSKKPEIRSLLK